ncbi:hypothetical protein BBK36DRAFT_1092251, partial [Trichoderma citrinoviride]
FFFLLGYAILGSASPLAGVAPSNSTSPLYNSTVIVANSTVFIANNRTLAAMTSFHGANSTIKLSAAAAAAPQDPPATPPSLNDLPACCVPCVQDGIKKTTQCTFEDVACICENKTKIGKSAKDCVVSECGLNNAIKVVAPAVKKLCDMDDDDVE